MSWRKRTRDGGLSARSRRWAGGCGVLPSCRPYRPRRGSVALWSRLFFLQQRAGYVYICPAATPARRHETAPRVTQMISGREINTVLWCRFWAILHILVSANICMNSSARLFYSSSNGKINPRTCKFLRRYIQMTQRQNQTATMMVFTQQVQTLLFDG